MTESLKIRPYARLLTMLGDQLIKNEQVALIEIIKNAYDADAKIVKISFDNFKENYTKTDESCITIEDNGHGMSADIIKKHWLNPATPEKKRRKEKNLRRTELGRVIQGDKGIGRFAIFKLGSDIQVVTRARGEDKEHVIVYDFGKYGSDFLKENDDEKDIFLDDLSVSFETRNPEVFVNETCGTKIEIKNLKGEWSRKKLEEIYKNFHTLYALFQDKRDIEFILTIEKDGEVIYDNNDLNGHIEQFLEEKSVFQITDGHYDEESGTFYYNLNGSNKELKLTDSEVRGLYPYHKIIDMLNKRGGEDKFKTACGSFNFTYYIFDFSPSSDVPLKYKLDKGQKNIIRNNKIYLYRDDIRVFPYGEPDDDWLQIDTSRGRVSAGLFLSTDQIVGRIDITQEGNPDLMDKTNREGLLEEGYATSDLIMLNQIFLSYIRKGPYRRYQEKNKSKKEQDIYKTKKVQKTFDTFEELLKEQPEVLNQLKVLKKEYENEKKYLERRVEITEELAGVGLSVEATSHDIIAFISRANNTLDHLIKEFTFRNGEEETLKDLNSIRGMIAVVGNQLQDIQSLFTSAKKHKENIPIRDILKKLEHIYKRTLSREKIELDITEDGPVLSAKTTDAVLLQLFINLFDNAIYWLQTVDEPQKKISIRIDGYTKEVIFADNGPGISQDDYAYIFEPFYSGKGEEGRGLGLYIARQLLEKNDYAIDLIEIYGDKILRGANFVIDFERKEVKYD